MISLCDEQLDVVMTAAKGIEPSRRSVFLERVAAMLSCAIDLTMTMWRGHALAVCGLVQHTADTAA